MKKIFLGIIITLQCINLQAMHDNFEDAMLQDIDEMLIWENIKEANLDYNRMLSQLFERCTKEGIKKLGLPQMAARLASTIYEHGWYNVLAEYEANKDPDFAQLTFLCQSDYTMPDRYKNTILHVLVLKPTNLPAVEFVITQLNKKDRRKAINFQNLAGDSPLHNACRTDSDVGATYLLSIPGVQKNLLNHFHQTPLDVAEANPLVNSLFIEDVLHQHGALRAP